MKKQLPFIIAAILITAFIFNNSLKSADLSTADSKLFSDIVASLAAIFHIHLKDGISVVIARKTAHVFEFAVQAIMIAGCFSSRYRKRIIYILFFGLLTACVDEYIQLFVPGRSGLVRDVFIDFSGTALGTAAGSLIYGLRR